MKQDNLTLEKVLDTENIVNECKLAATKFVEFMKKNPEYAQQTIEYAIRLPDIEDDDEKKLYKYPFVASEIFGAQIRGIDSLFFEDEEEEEQEDEEEEEEEEEEEGDSEDKDNTHDKDDDEEEDEDDEDEEKNEEKESKETPLEETPNKKSDEEEKTKQEETKDLTTPAEEKQSAEITKEDVTEESKIVPEGIESVEDQTIPVEEKSEETTNEEQDDVESIDEATKVIEEIPDNAIIELDDAEKEEKQKQEEEIEEVIESAPNTEEKDQPSVNKINRETKTQKTKPKLVGKALLNTLLSFLDTNDVLNDTSAGYFFKIVNNIFSFYFMKHIQEKPAVLELLSRHIRTKGVSEVVLKILTQNNSSENDMFIDVKKQLFELIISKFEDRDVMEHENISHVIYEVIQSMLSRDKKQKGYGLLSCIEENEELFEGFFKVMTNQEADHSSVSFAATSLGVILAFYNNSIRSFSEQDDSVLQEEDELSNVNSENNQKLQYPCEKLFAKYIPQLVTMLQSESISSSHMTSFGQSVVPLGIGRLKVVELIGHIFKSENRKLIDQLAEQDIFKVLLELMIKYPWNNLLHISIEKVVLEGITESAEGNSDAVSASLFGKFNLLSFIVQHAEVETGKPGLITKDIRLGYVGFLTGFAKKIIETTQSFAITSLKDEESWKQYVNTKLKDILERESRNLGADKPKTMKEEMEQKLLDDIEFKDIHKRFTNFYSTQNQYESGDIEEDDDDDKEEIVKEDIPQDDNQENEEEEELQEENEKASANEEAIQNKEEEQSIEIEKSAEQSHEKSPDLASNVHVSEKSEHIPEIIAESSDDVTHGTVESTQEKPEESQKETTPVQSVNQSAEISTSTATKTQPQETITSSPKIEAKKQETDDVQKLEDEEIKSEFIGHELWKQKVAHDEEHAKPIEKLLDEY